MALPNGFLDSSFNSPAPTAATAPAALQSPASVEKGSVWRRLVFAAAFFHAIVLERRKFGALGWNIVYDFTDGDLAFSLQTLRMFISEQVRGSFLSFAHSQATDTGTKF